MLLLVGNPTAQSGRNAERIDSARTLLARKDLAHSFCATTPAGGTVKDVARRLREGNFEAVVAMGGDGTFAEVAKALLLSGVQIPLGMLPTGTANDQGRSFGLSSAPSALARNVDVLAGGHTAPLDAGKVVAFDDLDNELGTDWFFDSMGLGMSARVLRVRNEDREFVSHFPFLRDVYRDQLVYAGAMLRALLVGYVDEHFFEAEVTTPHGVQFLQGLTDLIVKNTRYYAGAWIFDPTSSPEDGEMELVPLRGRQELVARALVHLPALPMTDLRIDPLFKLSPITRSPSFYVRVLERPMSSPVEAQVDGEEYVRAASYRIEVLRHALQLIVPSNVAAIDAPEPEASE